MFVGFERGVRVNLAVVTLGTPDRLWDCVAALRGHRSRHDFTVSVVINADGAERPTAAVSVEDGVAIDRVPINAGWSGGLHRARALSDAELLVWVQDDMVPEPGWLDALVDAADRHPRVGGFGSVRADADGRAEPPNAGSARPPDAVQQWNDSDTTTDWEGVTTHDWVTSTGFLTRARAWDDLGGADPRLWPVNHGDKDYCTHLRSHGWDVALVAEARVRHAGAASAPTAFRAFVAGWREPWFNARWAGAVAELADRSSAEVPHPCGDWAVPEPTPLEATIGSESSRMLVPLSRVLAEETRTAAHWHAVREDDLERQVEHYRTELLAASDRLAELEQERDGLRRRVRRLRRRLTAAEEQAQRPGRRWSRWVRRLG